MTKELNIYQRMHAAMKQIGTVKKDKRNAHQGYEYVSEEAIKTACHAALVDNGIVFNLEVTEHDLEWRDGVNKSGQSITTGVSNAKFRYHFTNIDKPDEKVSGEFYSMSADTSDKSFTKALTYAIREIMKSNFVISTGEPDPDSDTPEIGQRTSRSHSAPVAHTATGQDPASDKQIYLVKKLLGAKLAMFEASKGIKVDSLTKAQASALIETLNKKAEEPATDAEFSQTLGLDENPFTD